MVVNFTASLSSTTEPKQVPLTIIATITRITPPLLLQPLQLPSQQQDHPSQSTTFSPLKQFCFAIERIIIEHKINIFILNV